MQHRAWGWLWVCLLVASPAFAQSGDDEAPPDDEAPSEEETAQGDAEAEGEYDPRQMRMEGIDNDEAARSRFRVGQTFYQEGRFMEAGREFESAFELSERASLLFNAYLAYRDGGNLLEATRVLGRYLDAAPDVEDGERLRLRHQAMAETVARQQQQQEAEAAERRRLAQQADAQREETEQQRRRAEIAEGEPLNPIGFMVGGAGVAMLAGSLVSGLIANSRVSTLESNCPDDRCILGFDLDDKRDEADRAILATDILLFAGIATTAIGVALLFIGRGGDDDDESTPQASFGCDGHGCRADLSMEF